MGSPAIHFFRVKDLEEEFNNNSQVWRGVIKFSEERYYNVQKVFMFDEIEFVELWQNGVRRNYREIIQDIKNNS